MLLVDCLTRSIYAQWPEMGRRVNAGTGCNVKCCIAIPHKPQMIPCPRKTGDMSPQLTFSSLFCVLALAGLCVVTGARELAGFDAPLMAEQSEL